MILRRRFIDWPADPEGFSEEFTSEERAEEACRRDRNVHQRQTQDRIIRITAGADLVDLVGIEPTTFPASRDALSGRQSRPQ